MIVIGTPLTQWDTGRSVEIKNVVADHVHFANKGDSKAVIMDIVDSKAKIPDYLLQTGKQLCVYVVENGVTIESKFFFVTKRERPEEYVYDGDQRNYIYELITNAQTATEAANQSAQNANEAADKANQAAKSWVLMGEVKGESVVIDDAIDQTFAGFRIFGKTTQDGVPTPDAPVDLVSVENPTITVNEQSMLVPHTLRGIPVSSGGNYTDANGQQWICDEIDFSRGVYVQRVKRDTVSITGSGTQNAGLFYFYFNTRGKIAEPNIGVLSEVVVTVKKQQDRAAYTCYENGQNIVFLGSSTDTDETMQEKIAGTTVLYVLATPIETPLSEEELAAFATLHTSRYGTTVTNDQDAYMDIHYVMDAKKYIDSLVGTGASAGLVEATVE